MTEETVVSELGLGDFDPLKVHTIDPKTRRVLESKPFSVHCLDGKRFYEYPKGSKNLWYENREFAGRLGHSDKDGPVAKIGEPHVKWEPPKTEDQTIAEENAGLKVENAKLLAELAEIKAEQNKQAQDVAKPAPKAAKSKGVL